MELSLNRIIRKITLLICVVAVTIIITQAELAWFAQRPQIEVHDPTMIKDDRGVYTLLSTNNLLQIRQSKDMVNWKDKDQILSGVPDWIPNYVAENTEDAWAPHISYRNNKYWVYYCFSQFGTTKSVIGLATNPTLDVSSEVYNWRDRGEVLRTRANDNYNAIDPELVMDYNEEPWLLFGSWWSGLKLTKINPETGKPEEKNNKIYSIAARKEGKGIEGASIIKQEGYYYLFMSWGLCCRGTNSTYRVMVGRAKNITGPYYNKEGKNLMQGAAEEVLSEYGRYIGPGGGSTFSDFQRDYYVHHYYDKKEEGQATLQIREIVWTKQNWPKITQPYLGRSRAYEAEHAKLKNTKIYESKKASNKEYLKLQQDTEVRFNIKTLQSGKYIIRIRYSLIGSKARNYITVNGKSEKIIYTTTNKKANFTRSKGGISKKSVKLKKGLNRIKFCKTRGDLNLDRIDLIQKSGTKIEGGSFEDGVFIQYLGANNNIAISKNGWVKYEYVDFGHNQSDKYFNVNLKKTVKGKIEISFDQKRNKVITLNNNTKNQSHLIPKHYSGIHDIFIKYRGTDKCVIKNLVIQTTS